MHIHICIFVFVYYIDLYIHTQIYVYSRPNFKELGAVSLDEIVNFVLYSLCSPQLTIYCIQLLPPHLLGKTALQSTNNNPPPPPPPACKVTTKNKGALPPVQSSPSQTTTITNTTSPLTHDTMVHLGSSTTSTLSTFAPKAATPAKSAALPPIDLSHLHSTTTTARTTEKR